MFLVVRSRSTVNEQKYVVIINLVLIITLIQSLQKKKKLIGNHKNNISLSILDDFFNIISFFSFIAFVLFHRYCSTISDMNKATVLVTTILVFRHDGIMCEKSKNREGTNILIWENFLEEENNGMGTLVEKNKIVMP